MSTATQAAIRVMLRGWTIQTARYVSPRRIAAGDIARLAEAVEDRIRSGEGQRIPPPADLAGWRMKEGVGEPVLVLDADVLGEIAAVLDGGPMAPGGDLSPPVATGISNAEEDWDEPILHAPDPRIDGEAPAIAAKAAPQEAPERLPLAPYVAPEPDTALMAVQDSQDGPA